MTPEGQPDITATSKPGEVPPEQGFWAQKAAADQLNPITATSKPGEVPPAPGYWAQRAAEDQPDAMAAGQINDVDKAHTMAIAGDQYETPIAQASQAYQNGEIDRETLAKVENKNAPKAARAERQAGKEYDRAERKGRKEAIDLLVRTQDILDDKRLGVSFEGKIGDDQAEITLDRLYGSLGITKEAIQKAREDGQALAQMDRANGETHNNVDAYLDSDKGLTVIETRNETNGTVKISIVRSAEKNPLPPLESADDSPLPVLT